MKQGLILCLMVVAVALVSCSRSPKVETIVSDSDYTSTQTVAVMPFKNETLDVEAGELTRLFWALAMDQRGFEVQNIETTDELLRSMGVTLGEHLDGIDREELADALGTDALAFGVLKEASYKTLVVAKKISAAVEVEVWSEGRTRWQRRGSHSSTALMNPVDGFARGVVDKFFENAFKKYYGHPMFNMLEVVVIKMKEGLPGEEEEWTGW